MRVEDPVGSRGVLPLRTRLGRGIQGTLPSPPSRADPGRVDHRLLFAPRHPPVFQELRTFAGRLDLVDLPLVLQSGPVCPVQCRPPGSVGPVVSLRGVTGQERRGRSEGSRDPEREDDKSPTGTTEGSEGSPVEGPRIPSEEDRSWTDGRVTTGHTDGPHGPSFHGPIKTVCCVEPGRPRRSFRHLSPDCPLWVTHGRGTSRPPGAPGPSVPQPSRDSSPFSSVSVTPARPDPEQGVGYRGSCVPPTGSRRDVRGSWGHPRQGLRGAPVVEETLSTPFLRTVTSLVSCVG